jgi:hypothetical protein
MNCLVEGKEILKEEQEDQRENELSGRGEGDIEWGTRGQERV